MTLHFDGPEYKPDRDRARLSVQFHRIKAIMADGNWRTLHAISKAVNAPESSVSAQLRHLRKPRFGGHTVNRRHVARGLFEYQLILTQPQQAA